MVFLIFLFSSFAAAEDRRTVPVTLYLIIDGSEGLKTGKENAVTWVNDYIDRVLQDGDTLTVWLAAEKAELLFSESLKGAVQKETVKELLRSIIPGGGAADYAGALREAAARETRRAGPDIPYTLLITGVAGGFLGGGGAAELLRYSRIQEFSGWRVQMVGMDLAARVQKAVSGYMMGG
ncbi:MAG: hypothetical protein LBL19_07550 [Spirochaetaceae bacterium]|jgi:hypothetical protein|nr:hypothetical protein [Spirochaetaceae bacterium]